MDEHSQCISKTDCCSGYSQWIVENMYNRVCKSRHVTAEILRENRLPGTSLHNGVIDCILGEVCGGTHEVN